MCGEYQKITRLAADKSTAVPCDSLPRLGDYGAMLCMAVTMALGVAEVEKAASAGVGTASPSLLVLADARGRML